MSSRNTKWLASGVVLVVAVGVIFSVHLIAATSQPKIAWSPSNVYAGITSTTTITKTLTFTSDQALRNITLEGVPPVAQFVQIKPNAFAQVPAGQPQTVLLKFSAPATAQLGAYDGTIHIRAGSTTFPQTLKTLVTYAVVPLPPDPGDAGKATLAGIDVDGDGVRDDVQRWIVFAEPTSERMRQALYQEGRAVQQIILGGGSNITFDAFDKASTCVFGVGGMLQISPDNLGKLSSQLIAQFLNTDARSKTYLSVIRLANGRTGLPIKLDDRVGTCAFDPASLEN